MAVFGAPVSHGDDPDRAIAAALAVVERVSRLDRDLSVRIGIETGKVLALADSGDLRVTGEAVNAAARLQQAASPGEVLVGERTARACRRAQLERDEGSTPRAWTSRCRPSGRWRSATRGSSPRFP
jgi:class 3 adenylate cyclase